MVLGLFEPEILSSRRQDEGPDRPVAKKANPPKLNLAALAMIHCPSRPLTTAQTAQKRVFIYSDR